MQEIRALGCSPKAFSKARLRSATTGSSMRSAATSGLEVDIRFGTYQRRQNFGQNPPCRNQRHQAEKRAADAGRASNWAGAIASGRCRIKGHAGATVLTTQARLQRRPR